MGSSRASSRAASRQAVKLRPSDARMWCALGNCYKRLERNDEAIRCLERAAQSDDREGIAFLELARLYKLQGEKGRLQVGDSAPPNAR